MTLTRTYKDQFLGKGTTTTITWHWARQKIRGRIARLRLIVEMGCTCRDCGETNPEFLEFHHPKGRMWEPNQHNQSQRMIRYRKDWKAKRILLLCHVCNSLDGLRHRAARKKQVQRRTRLTGARPRT